LLLNGATLWLTSFEALAAAVTLVMAFALQHTQMRQQAAVQRKLDEILRVLPGADQRLLYLETAPQAELDERHGTVRDEALVDPAPASQGSGSEPRRGTRRTRPPARWTRSRRPVRKLSPPVSHHERPWENSCCCWPCSCRLLA